MTIPEWKKRQEPLKRADGRGYKIPCPECGSSHVGVTDTRGGFDGEDHYIRRRRACFDCEALFTTYETYEKPRAKSRRALVETFEKLKRLLDESGATA